MTYQLQVLKPTVLSNGFTWIPVHWSHDASKTAEWALEMRKSFPRPTDWDREMEIAFELQLGTPAYARYSNAKHLGAVSYDPTRPLALAMDFNANPMSLIVGQVHEELKQIHVLHSFVYEATIDGIINDFRDSFSEHRSDIMMYGDATTGMNAQTAKSNWDVVRLAFRGYHIQPTIRVPASNPFVGNRLNAVNRMLSDQGQYKIVIGDQNEELVRDLREVVLTPDGKKIHKVTDPDNPYYFRTHASDAFGYWIFREWPAIRELMSYTAKKRAPLVPGALLGEIDSGLKWREDQRKLEKKRKPLDRTNER